MRLMIVLAVALTGCANHPLDCALGNSYGPGYCQPGTAGYENEQGGRGVRIDPAALRAMIRQPEPVEPWHDTRQPAPVQIAPFTCRNIAGILSCQ